MARRHWCRFSDFLVYIFGCRERSLDCSQVQPRRRKEGFAGRTTIIISTSSGSQEITAGSCCPTNRSLGPEIPPRRQSPSKVKGEEKPRSALDPSTVERGQERSLWEPARLLYDVKSSWSAAGLLHQQHSHQRAASSPRASLRRLFRVGAFRPSKPRHQPPGCSCSPAAASDSTDPPACAGHFSEWQFCTPGF